MEKSVEDVSKHLLAMKGILFGDGENEPDAEQVQALGLEIESSSLIAPLLASISQLEFEARKDVVLLLSHMLRRHCPSTCTVLLANFDIVTDMIVRYDSREAALNFGSALRECIRVPALAQRLLQTRAWSRLLLHVESCRFDVSTDSFFISEGTAHQAQDCSSRASRAQFRRLLFRVPKPPAQPKLRRVPTAAAAPRRAAGRPLQFQDHDASHCRRRSA